MYMIISPDVRIKSTIRSGSVYLFKEDSFENCNKKHYFIVLNSNPLSGELLFLVWAKTLSAKVYLYIDNSSLPLDTFVDITEQCDWCPNPTVVDCNNLIEKDISELIDKLKDKKLDMIGLVSVDTLKNLVAGVLKSPLVDRRIKKLLQVDNQ
ncbi:hypothetical protein COU03_00675 [bacterium (Candidatus Gribaldobacteria) CG10_big_fil_rev_8_21_14_0_10_41_12]|uniref:Uncharacterized protein n=2 Tax=Bacteria candidate phyla TaxID=1783234 RepID=A0A2H0UY21_9BACT|nr:MAG: hypothetical protein COU03_00675 [bacterium (Candidatus Gribaldobacteria) CG10_big_fil_rev_8_21_14_0_10_41_12]